MAGHQSSVASTFVVYNRRYQQPAAEAQVTAAERRHLQLIEKAILANKSVLAKLDAETFSLIPQSLEITQTDTGQAFRIDILPQDSDCTTPRNDSLRICGTIDLKTSVCKVDTNSLYEVPHWNDIVSALHNRLQTMRQNEIDTHSLKMKPVNKFGQLFFECAVYCSDTSEEQYPLTLSGVFYPKAKRVHFFVSHTSNATNATNDDNTLNDPRD